MDMEVKDTLRTLSCSGSMERSIMISDHISSRFAYLRIKTILKGILKLIRVRVKGMESLKHPILLKAMDLIMPTNQTRTAGSSVGMGQ